MSEMKNANEAKKAVFPFSGDPITLGHIDVIKRAAKVFDEVTVAFGVNSSKNYLFTLQERLALADKALHELNHLPNVKIACFEGLLVDYAYEQGISAVIKGVRNMTDFNYEMDLHLNGDTQGLGIETFFIPSRPEFVNVSSSSSKEIQKFHGLINKHVPLFVKQALEVKLSKQFIVGITGEIGAGKSYVSKKFKEIGGEKNFPVNVIDLDKIGHSILSELTEPAYANVRDKIAETFGNIVKLADGSINRKALGEIVFNDSSKLKELNEIMYTPMITRLRHELNGKTGLVLIDAALLAESDLSFLCNNNVVLLSVDKESQQRRLFGRGLDEEQIERRLECQYSFEQKKAKIEERIALDATGFIWELNNSDSSDPMELAKMCKNVISQAELVLQNPVMSQMAERCAQISVEC